MTKHNQQDIDDYDVLSAMWILACIDQISTMTYNGIKFRLDLPETYDVRNLVRKHGELFRMKVPMRRLDDWKAEMRQYPGKRPSWIRETNDETDQLMAINALTVDDVFRSQFRIGKDAPPSPLQIMDWGLQHIERIRKARLESRNQTIQRLQLWSVIVLSILNLGVSIVIALMK